MQLQQITRTPNEMRESVETWTNVGDPRWARVTPITAKERLESDARVVSNVSHIVVTRYFPGLNSTDFRWMFRGNVLDIVGVIDIESRQMFWESSCNQVQT